MELIIHRGTHEIGGSCVELKSNTSRILLDFGMPLVIQGGKKFNIEDFANIPDQELISKGVLPAIKGIYSWEKEFESIDGLLISHPHADHYGLYRYLSNEVPVYLGEATGELIRITSIFGRQYANLKKAIGNPKYLKNDKPFTCGNFTITPLIMDHSAFDSYAFLIESNGRKLIYSGDFRHHGRKKYALPNFLKAVVKEPDAMLLEGTVMGRESGEIFTEDDVEDKAIELLTNTHGIVFLYFSPQNIDRLVSFYKAASSTKRLFVIDVYTAYILMKLKKFSKIPYPSKSFRNIRIFFGGNYLDRIPVDEKEEFIKAMASYKISAVEIEGMSGNIMMTIRGSMLNSLKKMNCLNGALFIYSMWEGYLQDKSTEKITEFLNDNHIQQYMLHTSGHASIHTLKYVVEAIKPKALIPIHTFRPDQYNILGHHNIIRLEDGEHFNI